MKTILPSLPYCLHHDRDRFGRVLKQVWTQGNSELVHLEYTYDRLGNRTSKRDVLAEQAGADLDEIYTYDQQNQLIDLDRVGNHEHFHYDTTGNWLAYRLQCHLGLERPPRKHFSLLSYFNLLCQSDHRIAGLIA